MGFKDFMKDVSSNVKKASQRYSVNNQLKIEATSVKKRILAKLTFSDLRHIYRQFGGTKEYIGGGEDVWGNKIPKRKANKYNYVEFLAKNPSERLILVMKTLGRIRLANDMEREIEFLKNKVSKKLKEINNEGKEIEEDNVLEAYINKIAEEITSIPTKNLRNEREYQLQLDGLFRGALKHSFKKQEPKIEMEYKTEHGRRIDILIQVGEYRIAVETKYNPQYSGEIQRAIGQSHEYSREGIDAYILVSFYPIEDKTAIRNLQNLKELLPIPLKVITGSRILRL